MPAHNSINVAVDLVTIAVLCVLMVAAILRPREGERNVLFIVAVLLQGIAVAADLLAWELAGWPGSPLLLQAHVSNMVACTVAPLACLAFAALGYTLATGYRQVRGVAARVLCCATVLIAFIELCLPLAGMFAPVFDEASRAVAFSGDFLYGLPYNLMILQLLLVFAMIMLQPVYTPLWRSGMALVLFGVPFAGFVLEIVVPAIALSYPAMAVALLISCAAMQREQEEQLSYKELELSRARNAALMAQIEPHFVANSLLAIEQLCVEDPSRAREAVQSFARYLRDNFEAMGEEGVIALSREIAHAKSYVALEMADPSNNVSVRFCISEDAQFALVPPLSVQPLVENAVRHGVGRRREGGTVWVVAAVEEPQNMLVVTVQDDGVGFNVRELERGRKNSDGSLAIGSLKGGRSLGLRNVRERLDLICQGTLDVASGPNGTCVTMRVPQDVARKRVAHGGVS